MITQKQIDDLATRTEDAYSAGNYSSWRSCAKVLVRRFGYDLREAEAVLRSKHTRWALDVAGTSRGTATDLADYLDRYPISKQGLAELVEGTEAAGFYA